MRRLKPCPIAAPPADRSTGEHTRPDRGHRAPGRLASLLGPAQECVASQRDAHGHERAAVAPAHLRQDPADLLMVAGMVGTRRQVELAGAAAEMGHGKTPAAAMRPVRKCPGIVARRRTLQAMEQDQQRSQGRVDASRCRRIEPVDVDEVAIGRRPALAPVIGGRAVPGAREQRRPDGLRMTARQPPRRSERVHQCSVEADSTISCASWAVPGLA